MPDGCSEHYQKTYKIFHFTVKCKKHRILILEISQLSLERYFGAFHILA